MRFVLKRTTKNSGKEAITYFGKNSAANSLAKITDGYSCLDSAVMKAAELRATEDPTTEIIIVSYDEADRM